MSLHVAAGQGRTAGRGGVTFHDNLVVDAQLMQQTRLAGLQNRVTIGSLAVTGFDGQRHRAQRQAEQASRTSVAV
jgi:hypothetical protein